MHLRVGGDDVAQKRLRARDVNGEIVVDKEDDHLTVLTPRALFQSQEFIHHAFIGAKPNRIPKETGYRTELAAIRTAAPRLNWDNAKRRPSAAHAPQQWAHSFGNYVELLKIHRIPRNRRIWPESRFTFLTKRIHRSVDFLKLAACRILNYLRPGFIGFTERNSIGVSRSASPTECFVRYFGDMRSTHHDRHSGGANRIGHAVGLRNHPGHCADAHESDVLFPHEPRNRLFIHRLGVAVNQ